MQGKRTANRRAAALRQALMLSISSMLICTMMLVGMTYAWFTDSAVTAVNAIHTGTVNVNVSYYTPNGSNGAQRLTQNTTLFNTSQWVPGTMEIRYLKIQNDGSLPVRYSLGLKASSSDSDLLNDFQYAFVRLDDSTTSIDTVIAKESYPTSTSNHTFDIHYASLPSQYNTGSNITQFGTLSATATDGGSKVAYYALILYYPGNSTQGNSKQRATIDIGLRLLAIQQNNTDNSQNSTGAWKSAEDNFNKSTITDNSNSSETSEN